MPLTRFEVRNEYGLGDRQLYDKTEDPKALLDGVAVAGLVGILRQLGDLAEFASDIFHDLHEQVMATSARGRKLLTRVQHVEATLPTVEKAIQSQRSHIHFAYVAGSDWHADLRNEQSHLQSSDLPRFMMDSYEECRDPPRLYMLDRFDNAGTGACLKRYSDPSYFKRVWAMSEMEKAEHDQREKKAQKIKRKRTQLKDGEVHRAVSLSRRGSSNTRFASSSTDEQSFSSEVTSVSDTRVKPKLANGSTSFDSRTRLNYVEQVPDMNSSEVPNELEYDRLSVSKLHLNQSGNHASDVDDKLNGISVDDSSLHDSWQGQSVHGPPSVKWHEKTEIVKAASPNLCDDILVDSSQAPDSLSMSSELSNEEHDAPKLGSLNQGDNMFVTASSPIPFSSENQFDEITSETDNYADALTTLESETETDCQTKWEVKSHDNFSYQGMVSRNVMLQETVAANSDFSNAEIPTASQNFMNESVSMNNSNLDSQESLEYVKPHEIASFASDPVYSVSDEIWEDRVPNMSRMSGAEGAVRDQPLQSSICNSQSMLDNVNTANSSKSQGLPSVNNSGVTFTQFWTNGSLLGLEPSKPPDFSVSDIGNEGTLSGFKNIGGDHSSNMGTTRLRNNGLDIKPCTAALSNEITLKNSSAVDGSPNASSSLEQRGLFDLHFGRKDNGVQHRDNQHDDMSVKQNSQRNHQPRSLKRFDEISNIHPQNGGPDIRKTEGAEFPVICNVESQPSEGPSTRDISSSFSALAQRFLANSLPLKASITQANISKPPGEVDADTSRSMDTPLLNDNDKGPIGAASKMPNEENINCGSTRNSVSSSSNYSGHSSPPLEHMKISFHPMNHLETSKLKLEFSNGNLHESIEDLMFPSFQLLPGATLPSQDSGSDSDDDTFCRSCPYTSEDHLSPRSDSNYELWGQDDRIVSKNHEMVDDVCRVSSSAASFSSFKGFDQMNQIDPFSGSGNLEAENDNLFQSSNATNLPGLDSFISSKDQHHEKFDSLSVDLEDSASRSLNELPPPPPLPPMEWRMMKLSFAEVEDKDSNIAETVNYFNNLQAQSAQKPREQSIPKPPPFPEKMAHPNKKTHDQQKHDGHMEPNHVVIGMKSDKRGQLSHEMGNKLDEEKMNGRKVTKNLEGKSHELDEREELLHQIKNKTFSLRRTATAKPSPVPQPTTNVNVAAILEKANAIRQAFVGSDDGGDDDNWSDG